MINPTRIKTDVAAYLCKIGEGRRNETQWKSQIQILFMA